MNINVRKARIEELSMVQKLSEGLFTSDGHRDKWLNHKWSFGEAGKKFFTRRISEPECICLVAELEGKVVGYLAGIVKEVESWRPVKRTELENMFVEEEVRSRGVGKELIKEFLKWSREKGAERAEVCAYASNDKAIGFYQRENFVPYSLVLEADV